MSNSKLILFYVFYGYHHILSQDVVIMKTTWLHFVLYVLFRLLDHSKLHNIKLIKCTSFGLGSRVIVNIVTHYTNTTLIFYKYLPPYKSIISSTAESLWHNINWIINLILKLLFRNAGRSHKLIRSTSLFHYYWFLYSLYYWDLT